MSILKISMNWQQNKASIDRLRYEQKLQDSVHLWRKCFLSYPFDKFNNSCSQDKVERHNQQWDT